MADYVEVVDAGPGWTTVRTADGEVVTVEGTRNWRNNNPGNLEYGPFAKSMGAIGTDGRFAVFPSYDAGRSAKENLIFSSPNYKDLPLSAAISRYAPSFENDTQGYLNQVVSASGVSADTPMSQIPAEKRAAILDAMQAVEGWRPGTINGAQAPAMAYAPNPAPRSQNPALKAITQAMLPDLGPPGTKSNGIGAMPKFGDLAMRGGIMRPAAAQPKGGGLLTAAVGGLGNLLGYAGQQTAPIMRGVQSAGQNATPSIMKAALGSIAGRTAVIDPMIQRVFSSGAPLPPNMMANAQRAVSQSGDTSVGNQAEAAAVRASADSYRNNRR